MVCKTEVSELKCWVYYTQGTRELIFVLPCTPVKDVFEYVEKHSKLQTFVLYFSVGSIKWINLCEMMNKTMAEVGVDFPSDRETKSFIIVAEHGQPPNMDLYLTYNSLSSDDDYINLKSHTKPKTNYVGLVNQAMTCYLNSLLQALYMTPEFRNALYNWEYVDGLEKDETKSIPYQLQKLFLNLQTSTKSAVETTSLTKSFGWNSNEAWQQQDIQELCRVMFDALELKFKNTEQADLINRLYEGKMIDYVRCLECGTEKSREDTFLDIPLPVRPFGSNVAYNSVEEAMRAFVQYETLDGTNQYHCEKCNKKCDAQKGLKFTKFPYLLTLHLKRFDFDYESFHRIKLNDKVTFPDILNLNSFIESPINQESPSGEEDAGLSVKCDDSSTTDSGTLDEDCLPCDNSFSNTNISTNPDQDDDEGIDMNNGPSTSNCNTYNNENEKHNSSAMRRGPYQYELFSIMIHSGSASGGHYYAYIKDFRTQEWWCFNDQSVSQITDDDIQKTYGGGQTRPYYSGVYSSSTNAYMLMYRQIDPARNALPMQAQDFPQHIQELLQKMKESEDNDKKNREKEISCVITKVYCHHPTDGYLLVNKLCLIMTETLAEATEEAYKEFDFKLTVNLDQCRLVSYDRNKDLIECSYEGREQETIASIWPNQSHFELLLDIRKKDQEFEIYLPGGITTKVFIIDVFKNEVIDGPINVRGLLSQTVKDYKIVLGKIINMDPKQMKLVLREHNVEIKFLDEDDLELQLAGFIYANQVFVSTAFDTEINKPFNESIMYKIIKSFESLISLKVELPYVNKELLENFAIPSLDDKYEEKEEPFSNGPSKSNAVRIRDYRNAIVKCTEILKDVKNDFYERDNYRTSLVSQFRDTEDWCTPEQSNSEDSSLSDSDKTLVGGAPEDDDFPLPYGVISENRRFELSDYIDIQNSDSDDESEYYFKVMPRTNSTQKLLRILVNKKMRLGTLKKDLEPYVGVRAAHFKVYRHFGDTKSECTCAMEKLDSYNDGDRLNLMLWRTLQNGEIKVKVYRLHIDSFTQPYHLLCETILSKDMTVAYAKKKILAEIKKKYDIDIPYEKCRLRKKCHMQASKVFLDKQKFEDLSLFITHEMIIQELPDKETVVDSNQTVIFVRRWSPAEMKLGQFQEIVLDEKSIEELRKKLASISDIPEECIDIAKGEDVFPCDISVLKVQNEHQWNESTTSNIHLDSKDGDVFLYRDSREKPKNLSADEKKEIINREVLQFLPLFQGRRYIKRKERALKIQFDTK